MNDIAKPMAPAKLEDSNSGSALARGLEVLSCFEASDGYLTNQAIADRCGLARATVTRITATLSKLGYLAENTDHGNRRFRLGLRTVALGTAALSQLDIKQHLRPMLQQLANATSTTVSLGVRDGSSMLYVEVCRSATAVSLTHQVGTRVPILTTAMGRAYLAGATDAELNETFNLCEEIDDTIFQQMRREHESARNEVLERGCSTSFGEWHPDVNAIAMWIRDPQTGTTFVVNCGGAKSRVSEAHLLEDVHPRLRHMIRGLAHSSPANAPAERSR